MQIINSRRSFAAANGCRILRPADRSCWLVSRAGRITAGLYFTRKAAEAAAAALAPCQQGMTP